MKRIATFLILTTIGSAPLGAMPSQITFQGTLKEQGVPVNSPPTKSMQFSFVDASGNQLPGTSIIPITNVQVTNGLFAVPLPIDPTIPWEQYTPYIRVSVEGQTLTPDQPVNANLYAAAAIPQGMIAIFENSCPQGWSEFTNLRGRAPFGEDPTNTLQFSVGFSSGSLTHNHGGATSKANRDSSDLTQTPKGAGAGEYLEDVANTPLEKASGHTHSISSDSSLPPYLSVIFCRKI